MKQTFKKNERLRSRKTIDRLFKRGSTEVHTFYLFPFRVLYIYEPASEAPLPEVLFSVSKRNFKKAVDRNLIRRRCRESYRLHKALLLLNPEVRPPSSIAFLYLAKEKSAYDVIDKAMTKVLIRLAKPDPS